MGKMVPGMNSAAASSCLPPSPRYYHTLFTHSLPKALRSLADDAPTCVDVLMNFLVASVTKLPPIKVPYGKGHQEARQLLVRMEGGWSELGSREGGFPLTANPNAFCCRGRGRGWVRKDRKPFEAFLLPILGAWGPRVRICAAARRPRLHQPDGSRVRPHAPGVLSPPSGPSALQGPGVRAAQEVSQPGEALRRAHRDPFLTPGGTASAWRGRLGSDVPSLETSRDPIMVPSWPTRQIPIGQSYHSARSGRDLAPPSSPAASVSSQVR